MRAKELNVIPFNNQAKKKASGYVTNRTAFFTVKINCLIGPIPTRLEAKRMGP